MPATRARRKVARAAVAAGTAKARKAKALMQTNGPGETDITAIFCLFLSLIVFVSAAVVYIFVRLCYFLETVFYLCLLTKLLFHWLARWAAFGGIGCPSLTSKQRPRNGFLKTVHIRHTIHAERTESGQHKVILFFPVSRKSRKSRQARKARKSRQARKARKSR